MFELAPESPAILGTFAGYLILVLILGVLSHRMMAHGQFLSGYFLGNRGMGAWMLALSVAATAISGGTFMGFPSLIYSNGWVMALWIAGYMCVPLMALAFMGRRLNQLARLSGAVTVPDILRERFHSPLLGILSSLVILVFLQVNLVAQFKGGGLVMKEALGLLPPDREVAQVRLEKSAAERFLKIQFAPGQGGDELSLPVSDRVEGIDTPNIQTDHARRQLAVPMLADGETQVKVVKFPAGKIEVPFAGSPVEIGYLVGLIIFAATVIGYTTYGGFWAVAWTDVLEGLVMFVGIIILAVLAWNAVTPVAGYAGLGAATIHLSRLPDGQNLIRPPGPGAFLPLGAALSFFAFWPYTTAGQPSGMVRMMAFKDVSSMRRALILVTLYYLVTYCCLLSIFICSRAIFPVEYLKEIGSEGVPDSIMPAMIRKLAPTWLAGFLLAAPFAAIMSTVAAFLLLISSSLIRDLFQRVLFPNAADSTLRYLSYGATGLSGLAAGVVALNPPPYLQYLIVFSSSGQACAFLAPMVLGITWKRTTRFAATAGLITGVSLLIGLYLLGWTDHDVRAQLAAGSASAFQTTLDGLFAWIPGRELPRSDRMAPLMLFGLEPAIWGMGASFLVTVLLSYVTRTADDEAMEKRFFD